MDKKGFQQLQVNGPSSQIHTQEEIKTKASSVDVGGKCGCSLSVHPQIKEAQPSVMEPWLM